MKGKLHSFELPYFLVKYNFGTWQDILYAWERQEMHAGVGLECLEKKDCLEELGLDRRIIFKCILETRITYVDSSGS